MKKEKVYIVISHKHSLKKGPGKQWEVSESVEFVNQLRNKHYTTSSAIGDYINRKMITGARAGMGAYDKFEAYVNTKYSKQMKELDAAYRDLVAAPDSPALVTDQFGNIRVATVFDQAA